MRKQLLYIMMLLLVNLLTGELFAADESGILSRNFKMGGSVIGLRGASKQDAEATFNVYLADLYKQNNLTSSLTTVMYPDSEMLLAAFDRGEIDGFFGTPLDYLSRREHICKSIVAIQYKYGAIKQRFLLVARGGEGLNQLKDLKNKRITLAPYMEIEQLFLNTILLRNQLPEIASFFQVRQEAKSPNVALMDVFFNNSDVTVVREDEFNIAIELNPQLGKKLTVISRSEPYLVTVGVINKKVGTEEFKRFVQSFNQVLDSERGKKLMDIVMVSKVAIVTDQEIDNLHELLMEYRQLKKSVKPLELLPVKQIRPDKQKNKRNVQ